MIHHVCERCGKVFNKTCNYKRHLIRTRLCEEKTQTPQINDFKTSNNTLKSADNTIHTSKNINFAHLTPTNKIIQCIYCNKVFSRSDTLNRHIKSTCKILQQQNKEKEKIYQILLKQINDLKEKEAKERIENKNEIKQLYEIIKKQGNELELLKLNNTTNNNITKNNTTINNTLNNNSNNKTINNLVINAFGKEDLSHLTDKDYKEIFYSSSKSVPKLISKIHFNRKAPSNSNVYISNIKDSYIMVYDGKSWNMLMKNEIIDELFDSKIIHLEGKYEEQLSKLDKTVKKRFDRFLFNIEHSSIEHDIKKEVKLLLYNSRVLALKNKKTNDSSELLLV
jgi:uncharacterized C2H2 Zn-finger protein